MLLSLLRSALLKAANKQTISKHPPLDLSITKVEGQHFATDGQHCIQLESEVPYYSNVVARDYEFQIKKIDKDYFAVLCINNYSMGSKNLEQG
jgi:hypothetical protein